MENNTRLKTGLAAAAVLLMGTLAVAQTAPTARPIMPRKAGGEQVSAQPNQNNQASGVTGQTAQNAAQRKSGSIIVMDRETTATQKNSAQATESVKYRGKLDNVQSNPLYEDTGKSGTNPLYESGNSTRMKTNTSDAQSQETKFKQDFGQVQPTKKEAAAEHKGTSNVQGPGIKQ